MTYSAVNISPERMKRFRQTARAREQAKHERVAARRERAWAAARQAALILKEEFGVQRVVLFGSLAHPRHFHLRSDIDLAVWGLEAKQYFQAVGRLMDLEPSIKVDLIAVESAQPLVREEIEQAGITL